MKITVTGGRGFIGAATAHIGKEMGHEVSFFDRRDGNDIMGSLSALRGSDAVIHLAGLLGTHELFDRVQETIDVNVTGSYRIMRWCLKHDARYVGIQMPNVFPSIYRATKMGAYYLAEALQHSRGLQCSHVRAFNAFGPGQAFGHGHPQKIVPTFAVNAWRGVPLPVWGDGRQTVDLVHVNDIARLLILATQFTNGEIFDGGTGQAHSVYGTASMVKAIAKSESPIHFLPMRDGETPTDIVAKGEGWDLLPPEYLPKFRYQDLVDTVEWYKDRVGADA